MLKMGPDSVIWRDKGQEEAVGVATNSRVYGKQGQLTELMAVA